MKGIGAKLSQKQDDEKLHPVAFASRALLQSEKNYPITELETLAVVWAVSHFHSYLYGHRVTVYTDHSAVKVVLETPNPMGKHARRYIRVYGRGVKQVSIVYTVARRMLEPMLFQDVHNLLTKSKRKSSAFAPIWSPHCCRVIRFKMLKTALLSSNKKILEFEACPST